jgi:hypothetical protein
MSSQSVVPWQNPAVPGFGPPAAAQKRVQNVWSNESVVHWIMPPGTGIGLTQQQQEHTPGVTPANAGGERLCITGVAHSRVPPTIAPRRISSRLLMPSSRLTPSSRLAISTPFRATVTVISEPGRTMLRQTYLFSRHGGDVFSSNCPVEPANQLGYQRRCDSLISDHRDGVGSPAEGWPGDRKAVPGIIMSPIRVEAAESRDMAPESGGHVLIDPVATVL